MDGLTQTYSHNRMIPKYQIIGVQFCFPVSPAFVSLNNPPECVPCCPTRCLFLPSLAPHNAPSSNTNSSGVSDGAVLSGMGTGQKNI